MIDPDAIAADAVEKKIDLAPFREFAEKTERKRGLQAELKALESELDALEPAILDSLQKIGTTSMHVALDGDPFVIYRSERLTARPCVAEGRTKEEVAEILRGCGWGDIVKLDYNTLSLDAAVRESLEAKRPLPQELATAIEIKTVTKVAARHGSTSVSSSARAAKNLKEMQGESHG